MRKDIEFFHVGDAEIGSPFGSGWPILQGSYTVGLCASKRDARELAELFNHYANWGQRLYIDLSVPFYDAVLTDDMERYLLVWHVPVTQRPEQWYLPDCSEQEVADLAALLISARWEMPMSAGFDLDGIAEELAHSAYWVNGRHKVWHTTVERIRYQDIVRYAVVNDPGFTRTCRERKWVRGQVGSPVRSEKGRYPLLPSKDYPGWSSFTVIRAR